MLKNDKLELLNELQQRVDELHREVLDSAGALRAYLSAIDNDRMPTAADCSEMIEGITSVRELHQLCEHLYQEFSKDELPETFGAFSEEIQRLEALLDKLKPETFCCALKRTMIRSLFFSTMLRKSFWRWILTA